MREVPEHPVHVDDQANPAVTQDRSAGHAGKILEHRAQVLDHDFVLADQFVHDQAETLAVGFGHHYHALGEFDGARLHGETLMQADHRKQIAADQHHLLAAFNCEDSFGARLEYFVDHEDRHDEPLLAHAHYQPVDYGERQRQLDHKRSAAAQAGFNIHAAAHF